MAWLCLILAGFEEIISVIAMRHVDGFKRKLPIAVMVIGFGCSFYLLSRAMLVIPAGVAYGVWAGVGAVGISIVGVVLFKEKLNTVQCLFLGMIIMGVMGLRFTT